MVKNSFEATSGKTFTNWKKKLETKLWLTKLLLIIFFYKAQSNSINHILFAIPKLRPFFYNFDKSKIHHGMSASEMVVCVYVGGWKRRVVLFWRRNKREIDGIFPYINYGHRRLDSILCSTWPVIPYVPWSDCGPVKHCGSHPAGPDCFFFIFLNLLLFIYFSF